MKICTIVGARPQFIKAAVVWRVIAHQDNIQEFINPNKKKSNNERIH